MINLLPLNKQREIKKHFFMRVFVFVSGMVIAVLILYFISLVPAYIIINGQESILLKEKELLASRADGDQYRLITEEVSKINADIDKVNNFYLARDNYKTLFPDFLAKKSEGMVIDKLSIVKDQDGLAVSVSGIAENRDVLSDFIKRLRTEKVDSFEATGYQIYEVTVPIVNFTDSENLAFNFDFKYGVKR